MFGQGLQKDTNKVIASTGIVIDCEAGEIMYLVVCLSTFSRHGHGSHGYKSRDQSKVFVSVSVIRGPMLIIAQMQLIGF